MPLIRAVTSNGDLSHVVSDAGHGGPHNHPMSLPLETPQPPRRSKRLKRSRRVRPPFSDRAAMAVAAVLRLGRLLVRRELRWADFRIAGRALVGRTVATTRPSRAVAQRSDFAATRIVARPGEEPDSDWIPPSHATRAIDVTEEPMHTLPAELQDIFARRPAPRSAPTLVAEPEATIPGV